MFVAIPRLAALAGAADPPQEEIVVRAERALNALDACLATSCPRIDDTPLSMASAEQLFRNGGCRTANSVLAGRFRATRAGGRHADGGRRTL